MEHGLATAEEVEHGLGLMKDSGNLRACYWICPFCMSIEGIPRQFDTAKDFLAHADACHEGVQMNEEKQPCCCVACNSEVSESSYCMSGITLLALKKDGAKNPALWAREGRPLPCSVIHMLASLHLEPALLAAASMRGGTESLQPCRLWETTTGTSQTRARSCA